MKPKLILALSVAFFILITPVLQAQTTETTQWELQPLVSFVSNDLDRYWASVFDSSGLTYRSPRGIFAYEDATRTPCGVVRGENALYCARSSSIHYDQSFLNDILIEIGDFAVAFVIAHEWGHFIQDRLGLFSRSSLQNELQADCLAGAYTRFADQSGILEAGDLEEGRSLLAQIGDPPGAQRSQNAHGTAQQRLDSFETGLAGGANACL